ncbi:MAG: inosine/xanthosine triphosphatase [Candidatus Paceibacterota bacterium]
MKKIAVGSQNPVKIEAVRLAFDKVWPEEEWSVQGVDVESGVPDQPMSDSESITGATNRAERALSSSDADFAVGLEGGIQQINGSYFVCGWVVIIDKEGNSSVGSSVRIVLPEKMMELIQEGYEVGEVNDKIFNRDNSKQDNGHFGLMTNNVITRTHGYTDGVVAALALFIHPELRT